MDTYENKPTREVVLKLIRERPEITETQIGEITGWSSSKITPARLRLWEAGEIAPTSEAGWKAALASRPIDVGWSAVADPAAREEVAARAKTRPPRKREVS